MYNQGRVFNMVQ